MNSAGTSDFAADFHLLGATPVPHVLVVDGSQIFAIDETLAAEVRRAHNDGAWAPAVRAKLMRQGIGAVRFRGAGLLVDPPLRALSLAVTQRCNLGCTYCYAEGGDFGGRSQPMGWDVAKQSIRRLFTEAQPRERLNLAFVGGEPLSNRALVRRTTKLAARYARLRGVPLGFSITTNGTLIDAADCDFLERYAFAVTVSLDGVGEVHDRLRPMKGGRGSFQNIVARLEPLLARQKRMQVTARVTVTPSNLDLPATLSAFIAMGFHAVGFSPLLSAPSGRDEMSAADLSVLLERMIACGRAFEEHALAGRRYPFSNMLSALQQIHRGTHRPYPCGAGAGYLGVSGSGNLYACHRFVEDPSADFGNVKAGIDLQVQRNWLAHRVVEQQEPCRSCWARYLCGGGCHYEVIRRGRPACDYIRGWLDYVMGAYLRLSDRCPGLFAEEGA